MSKKLNVAVVGATGAVGREMLKTLEKRSFPFNSLRLLASSRSAGSKLPCCGKDYTVEELTTDSFKDIDIALFSAGASRSKEFADSAVKAGAVVIDNSSAFRMVPEVPLVVPEVNPEDAFKHHGIIANPNCTTIIMLVALKPLHDVSRIKRIVVSTSRAQAAQERKECRSSNSRRRTSSPANLPFRKCSHSHMPSTFSATTPPSWKTATTKRR